MNLGLKSFERPVHCVVGIAAVMVLILALAWKFLTPSAASVIDTRRQHPIIVMPAGFQVRLGSEVAKVFGQDDYDCGDGTSCKGLVLAPNEPAKEVFLLVSGRQQTERWTFIKTGSGVTAIRPNGEPVLATNN